MRWIKLWKKDRKSHKKQKERRDKSLKPSSDPNIALVFVQDLCINPKYQVLFSKKVKMDKWYTKQAKQLCNVWRKAKGAKKE